MPAPTASREVLTVADDDVTDDEFLAEMLQHLGLSTVRQVIEEALREYVGDGDGADWLILAAHDREVAEKAWDEGMAYGVNYDMGDYEVAPEPIENPYREGGAS